MCFFTLQVEELKFAYADLFGIAYFLQLQMPSEAYFSLTNVFLGSITHSICWRFQAINFFCFSLSVSNLHMMSCLLKNYSFCLQPYYLLIAKIYATK